jgi:lysophospholipase L1-like esterase
MMKKKMLCEIRSIRHHRAMAKHYFHSRTWAYFLLLHLACGGLLAQTSTDFDRWEKEIAAFEKADQTNPPPKNAILFIGSSSIRLWKTLTRDFPEEQVFNRGFGGSQIIDSVHFADRIVFPYQPRLIVLYAGGNDINARKSAEQVFNDFKQFVEKVQARLPDTRIAYISIAPNPARWAQVETIKDANQRIEAFTRQNPKLEFINVFSAMLGDNGLPKPDIYVDDKLHMNAKGYAIWKGIVGPHLKKK